MDAAGRCTAAGATLGLPWPALWSVASYLGLGADFSALLLVGREWHAALLESPLWVEVLRRVAPLTASTLDASPSTLAVAPVQGPPAWGVLLPSLSVLRRLPFGPPDLARPREEGSWASGLAAPASALFARCRRRPQPQQPPGLEAWPVVGPAPELSPTAPVGYLASYACPSADTFEEVKANPGFVARLWSFGRAAPSRRCVMVGPSRSGKTRFLSHVSDVGDIGATVPTVGFNHALLQRRGTTRRCEMWDLGGVAEMQPYWRVYLDPTDAVLFFVDASSRASIAAAVADFDAHVRPWCGDAKAMVLVATHQDVPCALLPEAVAAAFLDGQAPFRSWRAVGCDCSSAEQCRAVLCVVDDMLEDVRLSP